MLPESTTIYTVISAPNLISVNKQADLQSKLHGYYYYEHEAKTKIERELSWMAAAVVPVEVTIADLVRLLNMTMEESRERSRKEAADASL